MLTDPLPGTLDLRKAASRGAIVTGTSKPLELPRFRDLLAADEGIIEAVLTFSRDEEGRYLVQVVTDSTVTVTCQRCLQPMPLQLHTDSTLAVVWTDEQARLLPAWLEPVIVTEEECSLRELVEDELILALPPFSYHEQVDCNTVLADMAAEPEADELPEKSNPFDVLAQLKPGDTHQE
ncbi:YceD family protein [Haliea sp. E1-2-M8]|uniref:YceD family protein n=1 Tax=Haliea sp. E1-2-M8 TaxID=3064706 RepID=UPI00271F8609|nr:YceD family protein [Haliea sp. E1-2-M8]MDO8862320.1 YceD family protein [Haliea sp. E1-2-M8]